MPERILTFKVDWGQFDPGKKEKYFPNNTGPGMQIISTNVLEVTGDTVWEVEQGDCSN